MAIGAESVLSDRYRLGEPLGRGGMADVVAGFDERLRRDVAVKLLRPELAARDDVRARFEAEARSAAKLVHPNVVAVFDSGEHEGTPFLIMERLSGETLADHIDGPSADPEWVARVGADVLAALTAAHEAGVVHRDVKPGNVLFDAHGRAKVADFGIAKSLEDFDDVTATSHVLGTPAYIAPERLEGATATAAADIYGLGVTLYEALTGQKPYTGATAMAVADEVRTGTPIPLDQARPGLPPALVAVVERAMSRDPAQRFGSAQEMAAAMEAAATKPPLPPMDETVALDTSATQVLPVAALGLSPDASATTSTPVGARAAPPIPTATPKRPRFGLGRIIILVAGALLVALLLGMVFVARGQVPLDDRIRQVATGITDDGDRGAEVANRLREVADRVEAGGGALEADDLLRALGTWRLEGHISDKARLAAIEVLRDVPGVNDQAIRAATEQFAPAAPVPAAPSSSSPTTDLPSSTTAPPRTSLATTTTAPSSTTTSTPASTTTTKGDDDDEKGKRKGND